MTKKKSLLVTGPAVVACVYFVGKSVIQAIISWIGLQIFIRFWNWLKERYGSRKTDEGIPVKGTSEET